MRMLVSVDISKGFAAWKQMAKDMAPEMGKVGVKMVWGGTNPDESKVFVLVEMEDPEQMKSFCWLYTSMGTNVLLGSDSDY